MNIESNLVEKLQTEGIRISFYDNNVNPVSHDVCKEFVLYGIGNKFMYSFKSRKNLTYDICIELIAKKQNISYIDYSKIFKKSGISEKFKRIYTTTYGFGIECIFFNNDEIKKLVCDYLDNFGIEYTNEYSEAGWVYRFKIGKSKTNIDKLLKLQND